VRACSSQEPSGEEAGDLNTPADTPPRSCSFGIKGLRNRTVWLIWASTFAEVQCAGEPEVAPDRIGIAGAPWGTTGIGQHKRGSSLPLLGWLLVGGLPGPILRKEHA
jgi:hypothetical protein